MPKKDRGRPDAGPLPESDPSRKPFTPETLDRTVIAIPLLRAMDKTGEGAVHPIIVDVNLDYPGGRAAARKQVADWIKSLAAEDADAAGPARQGVDGGKGRYSHQYVFARLSTANIRELVRLDRPAQKPASKRDPTKSAIYRIWNDFPIQRFVNRSVSTVKADAARNAFAALGRDIVWAVLDSGVDGSHPHFAKHANLDLPAPLRHRDFTDTDGLDDDALSARALSDGDGHGTHVAGIIAGECGKPDARIEAEVRERDETGAVRTATVEIDAISGVAPLCKILSLKVLADDASGQASSLISALEYIQELNGNGRRLRVHGVNMSVGYDFEPEWFACGQSPLCVEVDRLVRSGVVVVVAAGNSGYGTVEALDRTMPAGLDLTICDPGNAALAITVGSTHRDMPHTYGVSYFSSKGPTGDGRLKPDLVAPGEKIISCASGGPAGGGAGGAAASNVARYKEDSGTSMAAPHVSGAVAAFLSVRREFIGRAETVKEIFCTSATDLKRSVHFQGKGLVDLMRALQSV